MLLELFLWAWPRLYLPYILRRGGYLLGLAVLLVGPLVYVNVDLIRKGFKPSHAGLHIEADGGRGAEQGYYQLPEDDE
jgi:hypothetical protein